MLRRVVFAPRISQAGSGPGLPRRVSASAQQGHVDAARGRSLWQTCTQEVKKHRQAWLLGALGSLGCLVYVCCTDSFYVWLTSGSALAAPFTPGEKAPYVRDVVTEKADVLRTYVKEFDKTHIGSFVLVAGPEASGKTTCIEKAFDGWQGVAAVEVNLDATPPEAINFDEVVSRPLQHLKGLRSYTARSRVSLMDDYCRKWYGHPLVMIISIKSGNKPLEGEQAQIVAGKVLDFGRGYTYDDPTCPIIFETSVPKIADKITGRFGDICRAVYLPPMNLEEFKKAAPHAMLRNAEACKVLKVTGMSAEKISLHKLEGGGPGINTFEDLVTDYFYKVGPNVRRLADLVVGKEVDGAFAEEINDAHTELEEKLESLTAGESQFVEKLVAAGPTGCLSKTRDDTKSKLSLLKRPTSGTLVRKIHQDVTLHYVGHVYALLMQEHKNDDAKVRALMKQYGWVDMIDPKATASSA